MSAKWEFLDRSQRWLIVDAISIRNIKQNRRSWKSRWKIPAEAWLLKMIRSFIIQQQLGISRVRSISLYLCADLAWTLEILMTRRLQWFVWAEHETGWRQDMTIWHTDSDPGPWLMTPEILTIWGWISALIDTTCHVSQRVTCHVSVISSHINHPGPCPAMPGRCRARHSHNIC